MTITKVICSIDQYYNKYLSGETLYIFNHIKQLQLPIVNITFRQLSPNNILMVMLYVKSTDSNNLINIIQHDLILNNLKYLELKFETYNQIIFGEKFQQYIFSNGAQISYTIDSFLQRNLLIAENIYNKILEIILYLGISNIDLFGEDSPNIVSYLTKNNPKFYTNSYVHYESTLNLFTTNVTTNINKWVQNNNKEILIVTPGRKGLRENIQTIFNCQHKYILYLGCCPNTIHKDEEEFNRLSVDNISKKYYRYNTYEYPEMFTNDCIGYLETLVIFVKPTIISLGADCSIAYHLNNKSYPFDWCTSPYLSSIINIIKDSIDNNFTIDTNKISKYSETNCYFSLEDNKVQNMCIMKYTCNDGTILKYPHDVRSDPKYFNNDYEQFIDKLNRRFERLLSCKYQILIGVRYEPNPQRITKELLIDLLKTFHKIIIIVPENKYSKIKKEVYNYAEIIEDKWGKYHNSWKKEGLKNICI